MQRTSWTPPHAHSFSASARAALLLAVGLAASACDPGDEPFPNDDVGDEDSDGDDDDEFRIEVAADDWSTPTRDAVVRLQIGGGYCTGTLVAPHLVMTAAHCFGPSRSVIDEWCDGYWHYATMDITANFGPDASDPIYTADGVWVSQPPLAAAGPWLQEDIALVALDHDVPATVAVPRPVALDRPRPLDPFAFNPHPEMIVQVGYGGGRDRRFATGSDYVDWLTDPGWLNNAFKYTPFAAGPGIGDRWTNVEGGDSGGPMLIDGDEGHVFGVLSHWDPYGIATFGPGGDGRPSIRDWLTLHLPNHLERPDLEIVSIGSGGCYGTDPVIAVTIRNTGATTGQGWVDVFAGAGQIPPIGTLSSMYTMSAPLAPAATQTLTFPVYSDGWSGDVAVLFDTTEDLSERDEGNNGASAFVSLPSC